MKAEELLQDPLRHAELLRKYSGARVTHSNFPEQTLAINDGVDIPIRVRVTIVSSGFNYPAEPRLLKPHLIHIEDVTEELADKVAVELFQTYANEIFGGDLNMALKAIAMNRQTTDWANRKIGAWYRKNGYDADNLIELGLAIRIQP